MAPPVDVGAAILPRLPGFRVAAAPNSYFRSNLLLEGLPSAADLLASGSDVLRVPRRSSLWAARDPADRVFWIRSGVVKLYAEVDPGRELTLDFVGKGALVGEGAMFGESARANHAASYEECSVYVTPASLMDRVLDATPALARRISSLVAARHRRLESRLGTLLFRGSHARIASLLLELADDFGVRDSRGVIVNLALSHRELAALIGATRETVSLALLEMRRVGLLEADGRRMVLLDPERLAAARSEPGRRGEA